MSHSFYYAPQFGQPAQSSDQWITRHKIAPVIREHMMPVIRPEGKLPVFTPGLFASYLLAKEHPDQGDHIGITVQMCRLFERPIRLFSDIAQVNKVNAICNPFGDFGHVVTRMRPERSRTQSNAIRGAILGIQDPIKVRAAGHDAWQAKDIPWRIVRMYAKPHPQIFSRRNNFVEETFIIAS
jgi:hypothetical protein